MPEANDQPVAFIDDGYTREETIPACQWHPEVSVRFRPFTYGEKRILQERIGFCTRSAANEAELEKGITAGEKLSAEALAKHITNWSIRDSAGNVVKCDAAMIQKLEPHLSAKLYNLITGEVRTFQPVKEKDESSTEASDLKN